MGPRSDRTVGATYAVRHFRELLDRVGRGETLAIERHGQVIAIVQPPETSTNLDRFLAWRTSIGPLDDAWPDDLEAIHAEGNLQTLGGLRDPWDTQE